MNEKFPTYDITHKPKRYQADNIKKENKETMTTVYGSKDTIQSSNIPTSVTIEKAIKFYESNAEGDCKILYSMTAKWLRELMTKNIKITEDVDRV